MITRIGIVTATLAITFIITWLMAKLHIFDLIGRLTFGCGTFVIFRLLEVAAIFFLVYNLIAGYVEEVYLEGDPQAQEEYKEYLEKKKQKEQNVGCTIEFALPDVYFTMESDPTSTGEEQAS